jgi:hypothetical protein
MPLSDADAATLRDIVAEIAPQMPGLSGPEQACVLGLACVRARVSPTWGEWATFMRELQTRDPSFFEQQAGGLYRDGRSAMERVG